MEALEALRRKEAQLLETAAEAKQVIGQSITDGTILRAEAGP